MWCSQLGPNAGVVQPAAHRETVKGDLKRRAALMQLPEDAPTIDDNACYDARNTGPPTSCLATDKRREEQLFQTDPEVRLLDAVAGWLAAAAREQCREQNPGREGMWASTQAELRSDKALVQHLDPDASTREARRLHTEDEEQESELLSSLWQVRRRAADACYRAVCPLLRAG